MYVYIDSGLVASVGGISAQSPEFESHNELATSLKNCRMAKDHPNAAITLSLTRIAM